jgi:hypothetical protein
MIRVCEKCGHVIGQRHCVYCGHGEPGHRPRSSYGLGIRPKNHDSRQQKRRRGLAAAMASVRDKNLAPVFAQSGGRMGEHLGWSGMSRRERRKLAKAYSKGEWRRRISA